MLFILHTCSGSPECGVQQAVHLAVREIVVVELVVEFPCECREIQVAEFFGIQDFGRPWNPDDTVDAW
ncbi:MAG: hypothetical protein WC502_03150 [Methanolinea sp.]